MPIRLIARLLPALIVLLAATAVADAQLPFPHKSKNKPAADQDLTTVKGVLLSMSAKEMMVQTDDKRVFKILRADTTKFLEKEEPIKSAEILVGDRVMVDASEDNDGKYTAVEVRRTKHGTAQDQAQARADVPIDQDAPPPQKTPEKSASGSAEQQPTERPATELAPPTPKTEVSEEDRPKLTRGKPSPRKIGSNGETEPDEPIAPKEPPPQQQESASSSSPQGRNPSQSDDPRDYRRDDSAPPSADQVTRDTFIDQARDVAQNFVETLPDYTVKQFTTRFQSDNPRVNWQPLDNVSAEVVYEHGKESYKNILVNGKPPKGKIEDSGSWSTGEFGSVLRDLFSPYTAADFVPNGNATIVNRSARVYKFSVEQPNSHWRIVGPAQSYMPAFKGTVWIDKENFRVLRIEMQTRNMPKDFSFDTVESTLDYDYIRLGGVKDFLLPVHAENLICVRGSSTCSKNVIDFRNYRKFGAETTIIFK
ncbi:MAG TPA: hypothetical protein VGL53_00255 [Bryobacteraceae bacterium]|jgi:hypothetical protein